MARKEGLLAEYQRNKAKLSSARLYGDVTCKGEAVFGLDALREFKWSPDGTSLLSTNQGYLHLISLRNTTTRHQRIKIDSLIYAKFLSKELILCITESSLILYSSSGEEIASVHCLHFDKDTSVLGSYLHNDSSIIAVFTCGNNSECTALFLKKNGDVWSIDSLSTFAVDHVFECSPFYANHDQDSWTIHRIASRSLEQTFTMAGSCPVCFSQVSGTSFLLSICREELVLLSQSRVIKSLPIEDGWYSWTRSGRHLLILYSQHIAVIDIMNMDLLAVLPHSLSDLTAASMISVPSNNPRLLLVNNNGSKYFYRIKF